MTSFIPFSSPSSTINNSSKSTTTTRSITTFSSSSTHHPDQYINQLSNQIKTYQDSLIFIRPSKIHHHHHHHHHHHQPNLSQSISIDNLLNKTFSLLTSPIHSIINQPSSSNSLIFKLDPHHLYYLLLKFDQYNLQSVPLDINLTKNHHKPYDPTNWMVGFDPTQNYHLKHDRSDTNSLFSNLSLPSTWWAGNPSHQQPSKSSNLISNLLSNRFSTSSQPHHQSSIEDQVKLIYSTFTKLPSLRLTPSSTPFNSVLNRISSNIEEAPMQLLEGFTDLPNSNAVPLSCFKSIWSLYLENLDPRMFCDWFQVSQNLRSLEIRKSGLEDFESLLIDAIIEDMDREKKRKSDQLDLAVEQAQENLSSTNDSLDSIDQSSSSSPDLAICPPEDSLPTGFPTFAWAFLQHLCLANNSLTFLPTKPLIALKSLVSLDLSSNLLIAVPSGLKSLPNLKLLNLGDNMIDSVLGIYQGLGNITSINLSRNRLSSICGLERLSSMERLDIRVNQIHDISELSRLSTLPKLTSLWTSENPFCKYHPEWRIEIFNYFSGENRKVDYQSDLLINLRLENQTPSYSERKLIKKPIGRPSTPENSVQHHHSIIRTIVKSPETKSSTRAKADLAHDQHPDDSSPSSVTEPVPSSSGEISSDPTTRPKRVVTVTRKQDKPHRRKTARIIDLDSRSQQTPGGCLSSGEASGGEGIRSRRVISLNSTLPSSRSSTDMELADSPIPSTSCFPTTSAPKPSSSPRPRPAHSSLSQHPRASHDGLTLRKRIEALKVEVGEDAWLRVLGESEFGNQQS